ncbi:chorismate-binding protein [Maribacter sp. 2307UL18-2]|uniref:chorismate-binding protein n=1 Tax=Maribacter sp. 2307UL18-2 TaxID=3386274 RepID=UPI0039BC4CFF
MFGEFLDEIKAHHAKNLPFAAYRMPKEQQVVALLQEDDAVHHLTNFTTSGFVFAPFDNDRPTLLLHSDQRLTARFDVVETDEKERLSFEVDTTSKSTYIDLVNRAIEKIKEDELEKVVLSRKVEVICTLSPLVLFQRLLEQYQNAFCYLWYHPKVGTWLGATPEILMKSENQRLTTMSLAGTQKYNALVPANWGAKELEEQELVTRYIASVLKDKVTNLDIGERETIQAGTLLHLRTKLVAIYEKGNLGALVKALHPTPAVCGMPMALSKKFIAANEAYDRSYYTGFLGELNTRIEKRPSGRKRNQENRAYVSFMEQTIFFVNLRCMQLQDDTAIVYVGGGITKDSNAELEWEETIAKTNTMLQVLAPQ